MKFQYYDKRGKMRFANVGEIIPVGSYVDLKQINCDHIVKVEIDLGNPYDQCSTKTKTLITTPIT